MFQPREEKSERGKRVKGRKPSRIDFYWTLPPLNSFIHIIQSLFWSCSCSSFFFPPPPPFSLRPSFQIPLPYTSLKLRLASLSFAPRCRTRSKLQKDNSSKTNRPLRNNLAGKAENLNQADKKWQKTHPFAINRLDEKDILWVKSLFLSFSSQLKAAWLLVSMYEQYVFISSDLRSG